ncbi:hypothetical protein KAR91_33765 [Candidatus Pacearchaeota archaeon]|nr:hypothetical protein [Candidatus Pacearchaeota archaeon]
MIKTPSDLKQFLASLVDRESATKEGKTVKVEFYLSQGVVKSGVKHSVERVEK